MNKKCPEWPEVNQTGQSERIEGSEGMALPG